MLSTLSWRVSQQAKVTARNGGLPAAGSVNVCRCSDANSGVLALIAARSKRFLEAFHWSTARPTDHTRSKIRPEWANATTAHPVGPTAPLRTPLLGNLARRGTLRTCRPVSLGQAASSVALSDVILSCKARSVSDGVDRHSRLASITFSSRLLSMSPKSRAD